MSLTTDQTLAAETKLYYDLHAPEAAPDGEASTNVVGKSSRGGWRPSAIIPVGRR